MNYGFYDENLFIKMDPEEERERYPAQLYHHTASQEDISEKKVLEVGSGRGGGASYVSRYLKPKSVVGIDISKNAVGLCNSTHQYPNLSFCVGDSEKIPFENESFDVVLNVESSHCYGNIPLFLTEVNRVLKPGGFFLWADFIAGIQLLVYIGGINVLIIFGIMLTNKISSVRLSQTNVQQGVGAVIALWLMILISLVISKTPWLQIESSEPSGTVHAIGTLLLSKYLLPFEAISLLLLGALIGAALLSREAT